MNTADAILHEKLVAREQQGLLRKLYSSALPYDFCSNDYLGFARSEVLAEKISLTLAELGDHKTGATGSRLISGNHPFTEATETSISRFHGAESGLIFNSGYDANLGLLSAISQRGDTIITDELVHASLIDGARLGHAERFKFKHNDLIDLERKLKHAKGTIYVIVESVYSMDGDLAPLSEISSLCERYMANLIVDEAHAVGVIGPSGRGLVAQLGLEDLVFARIVTFGKALGVHGGIVLGSNILRNYLINFARSFIYTTAAPLHHIVAVHCAYGFMEDNDVQQVLQGKILLYQRLAEQAKIGITNPSAIQTILLFDNNKTKEAARNLQEKGFDVKAILSPTVQSGKERLRICLHAFNTDDEIIQLVTALKTIL